MLAEIQKICAAMGKGGCFEFAIMAASEVACGIQIQDPTRVHQRNLARSLVTLDCYVGDAGRIMASLCGGDWICLKAGTGSDSAGRPYDLPIDYQLKPGEHDIARYEIPYVKDSSHFFYAGPGPLYDSYGESLTRTTGTLQSRRILRRIG
jgi:hypothetical protein